MSQLLRPLFATLLVGVVCAAIACAGPAAQTRASAGGPPVPALDKATAAKILTFMGKTDVTIAGVVQAPAIFGGTSDHVSLVIAAARDNGQARAINEVFLYDPDLGWFFSEPAVGSNEKREAVRIWSASGYKEITAAQPK